MKLYSTIILLGTGFVLCFGDAQAQGREYDRNRGGYDDGYYGRQDDYRNRGRYSSGNLIGQVLSDIDRAASNARLDEHETKHFDEAARKLQEFEDRWSRGNFDNGKLDKAIENIQHLADADRVHPRDRDILNQDLAALRQFRSTRGRYSNDGYRENRDDRYYRRY